MVSHYRRVLRLNKSNAEKLKDFFQNSYDEQFADCVAVPYEELVKLWNFLPYGNRIRVWTMFLFLSGCRPSESQRMQECNQVMSFIRNGFIYWRVGKNQKGRWRKEPLSVAWVEEWLRFKESNLTRQGFLFPHDWLSNTEYFNKRVRPLLGGRWLEKRPTSNRIGQYEYVLQIKGIRKSWACLTLAKLIRDWKGDSQVAVDFLSARMVHSNKNITVHHYLRDFQALNMDKWGGMEPADIIALADQKHIEEYAVEREQVQVIYDNPQLCLLDIDDIRKKAKL